MKLVFRNNKSVRTTIVAVAILATAAIALAANWVKLGDKHVTDRADHDTVVVSGARGKFSALKFHVKGHAVQFHKVVVHYHNGTKQELQMRDVVPAGGESRVIDLAGGDRVIKTIDLWYDAQTLGRAGADVAVWGRR